ncbi:MAG TPA: hypothetical protein VKZ70_11760 [Burkholderiaceae bacterium]|nr:hypothetical protein [Burkholderiaceae bacterium]
MDVDNDIEVWLETDQNRGNLMTPYLQSKTLGSIGMSVAQGDDCYIELSLVDGGALIASYILSCPEPVAQ